MREVASSISSEPKAHDLVDGLRQRQRRHDVAPRPDQMILDERQGSTEIGESRRFRRLRRVRQRRSMPCQSANMPSWLHTAFAEQSVCLPKALSSRSSCIEDCGCIAETRIFCKICRFIQTASVRCGLPTESQLATTAKQLAPIVHRHEQKNLARTGTTRKC